MIMTTFILLYASRNVVAMNRQKKPQDNCVGNSLLSKHIKKHLLKPFASYSIHFSLVDQYISFHIPSLKI